MCKWHTLKIKDAVIRVIDNRGKTPACSAEGNLLLEVNAVLHTQKYPDYSAVKKHISADVYASGFRSGHPQVGDILVPTVGTLGAVAYVNRNNCCIAQNLIALRADEKICRKDYLYYVLADENIRKRLLNLNIGAVQPSIKVPHLLDLSINLPPLPIQQKIANILCTLDEKIENNTQINHNLEEQAKTIFKSWFVDFEPFRNGKFVDSELGPIPEGWEISTLDNIADYLNGLAMQKYRPNESDLGLPVLKIKELRQGVCDNESDRCSSAIKDEYIVKDGDVIFSWSGSLLVDFWTGGECGLNQHLFKVTSSKYEKWFYFSWTQYHLAQFITIAADKATTMGHIKRENLQAAKVLIPPSECYNAISVQLTPIYDLIIQNRIEARRLAQLRNSLLPKLMSGEIDVSEINLEGEYANA